MSVNETIRLRNESTSAVILAGGLGKRFGSYKPVFPFLGQTLLEHIVKCIRPFYEEILVIAGNESQKELMRNLPSVPRILTDTVPGTGPLGGILTGALLTEKPYCQILPVDSPTPNARVLNHLAALAEDFDGAVPKWPSGRTEPLHAVYKAEAAARKAKSLIEHGERSAMSLVTALPNIRYVDIDQLRAADPDLDTFANINTRDDLERMAGKLRERT